jgi:VCBS repeat-containing protein
MPVISQTIQSRVTGLWGSALIKGSSGRMRVLKVGDEVVKGDVILTTQNGIVRLSDARETVTKTSDIERIVGANQGDLDINPAAGLLGGDAGGFEPGLRVDRVLEGVTPAGLLVSSANERLPFNFGLISPLAVLGAVANESPFSAASSNISAIEEGAPVNLGLTLPVGVPATTVVNIGKLPVIGAIQKSDGTVVTPGTVLTAADLPGLKYVPPADYNGTSPVGDFVYTVSNGTSTVTGTTTIGLTAINDAPVATPGEASGLEDATLPVSLGGTDVDGTIAGVTIVSLPPGSRLLLADGVTPVLPGQTITAAQAATLLFQPAPNFSGNAGIVFTVTDDSGAVSAPATVNFNIIAVNDAPVAAPDVASTREDTPISGNLLTNDTDVDSPNLSVVGFTVLGQTYAPGNVVTLPGVGTLTVLANGDYTFTPAPNYNGTVPTIGYTVSDGSLTSSSTLTLTVSAQPDPAIISGQASGATIEDDKTTATGTLTVVDPDAGEAAFVPLTAVPGAHGSFSINAAGVWVYTLNNADPAVQALGAGQTLSNETFTVTSIDGTTQVVTISITGTNDAPVASPAAFSVTEGGVVFNGQVTATDLDANAVLTFALNGPAPAGLIFNANGSYSFDPSNPAYAALGAGQQQVITVPFTVTDDQGATSTRDIVITITGTNGAPVAVASAFTVAEDAAVVNGRVSATDPDANAVLGYALNGAAPAGLTFRPDGSYSFDPSNAAYQSLGVGQQSVIVVPFTVTDDQGATSTKNLVITVTGTNDAPVAVASAFTVNEDAPIVTGSVSATDIDANAVLTFALNGASPAGLIFNANGSYSFDPSNAAYQALAAGQQRVITVPYTVTDDQGATSTQDLVITIIGTNDAPVARPDNGTVIEDTPLIVAASNGLLANDTDVDFGTSLRVTQFSVDGLPGSFTAGQTATIVGLGTLLINADGSYTFTPAPNYAGAVPLVSYTISDGTLSASSTLTLSVTPVSDAPILSLDGNSSHNTVSVQTITGLFNTGVNDAGAALAEGTSDSHYRLISAPAGSTTSNNALQLGYAWLRNDADSSWIGSAGFEPTGIYKYQTAFTLQAGADPRSVHIGFDIATDNYLRDILVNGVSTGISSNVQYRALTHLELNGVNAAFQAGANTITFVVDNRDTVPPIPGSAGPTGLRIDNMTAKVAVITPSDVVHVADYATIYVEGTPVSIADGDNHIRDVDSATMQSATITLTNAQVGDVLLATGMPPGITATVDATGTIVSLSGNASNAAYEAALHAVQFSNTSSSALNDADRLITVVVNDGVLDSNTVTTTVHVVNVNTAPTLDLDANDSTATGTGFVGSALNNGSPVQFVDTDVRVGDNDNALIHSATVSITDVRIGDILSASTLPAGITASQYDPITGVLVLVGSATLADYQLALRGVAFSTTADAANMGLRTIEVTVNDGTANSNVALSQITVGEAPAHVVQSTPGDDVMTGLGGHDVFHWSLSDQGSTRNPARDIVTNFGADTPGVSRSGDVLDLRDLLVGELHTPNAGNLPGAVTADVGNLDQYLHFSLTGTGTDASTVIAVSSSGGYTGGVYNAGAVNQVITLAGVNLIAGFTTDHQVLDDLLKRGKLVTDTA